MKKRNVLKKICIYLVLLVVSLFVMLPIYLIVVNSLKTEAESVVLNLAPPAIFQFSNYLKVIQKANIPRAMFNGLLVSVFSVITVVIVSSMASFLLARRLSKTTKFLYYLFVAGLIAPLPLIPTMRLLQSLNIINTYFGIICIFISVNIPFSIFLYSGFIKGIPRELDESAILDGCGPIRLFYQIIFPLLKPVVFTNIILVFMNVWNDFQYTLYFLGKSSMWNMPLTVYKFVGKYTNQWELVCADLVLTILPVILIYIFAQKYIISGMTAGAVKG